MSDINLSVRVGIPGSLTIEVQAAPNINAQAVTLNPPLRQAVLNVQATADTPGPQSNGAAQGALMSQQWGQGFMVPLSQIIQKLRGNTLKQVLALTCPSWDQTDNAWGMTADADATTNPLTIVGTPFGMSNYGRMFGVGDYVLWNDPTAANGLYSYEIDLVTAASGNTLTLQRSSPAVAKGRAMFGTPRTAHAGAQLVQLQTPTFWVPWDGTHQLYKFLWDQMIVCAVSAETYNATPSYFQLASKPPATAAPGLST